MGPTRKSGQPGEKVCVRCGADVAGRPRAKDRRGRYMCGTCFTQALEARRSKGGAGTRWPTRSRHTPPSAGDAPTPDVISMPRDPGSMARVLADVRTCRSCGQVLPGGAAVCMQCGFDHAHGRTLVTQVVAPEQESKLVGADTLEKCPTCGYSLREIETTKCPECGTRVYLRSWRERANATMAMEDQRSHVVSAATLVVATMTMMGVLLVRRQGSEVLAHLVAIALAVPLGAVVHGVFHWFEFPAWIFSSRWTRYRWFGLGTLDDDWVDGETVELDGRLWVTLLQLTASFAVFECVTLFTGGLGTRARAFVDYGSFIVCVAALSRISERAARSVVGVFFVLRVVVTVVMLWLEKFL